MSKFDTSQMIYRNTRKRDNFKKYLQNTDVV